MDNNNPTPAGEATAPQTEAQPTINNVNQPAEAPITQAPVDTPKAPDLHGFTEEQLADMAKFYAANGGYDKVKSRLSNPQQVQPQQAETQQQFQQREELQQPQEQALPPRGYASLQELSVERYFKDLAADPKYANISDQISSGAVLEEMANMGMAPIDQSYNINIQQLRQFLDLKSASIPTKPTSVEPTTTPTVDYVPVEGDTITSVNQALDIVRQSTQLRAQGMQPHPAELKAKEYLTANKFGQ